MIKNIYNFGRKLLRLTGRDVFRADTLASLTRELESQKQHYEAQLKAAQNATTNDTINALRSALELQNRYQEAYRLEKNLIPLRPDRYSYEKNVNNDELLMFKAQTRDDFDWLEEAIFKFGYYEKPGVWRFVIDEDKRTMAELVATFKPQKTLDFGCANGPLIQAQVDLGMNAEGVEISSFALEHAFPGIKARIHHGDLLQLPLAANSYDVITGLDIFEHLNPNKLDACISKLHSILRPGAYIFANIPAFGRDEVFGEVFDYYMPDWNEQRDGSSYFKTLHVDMHGYPVNGHLIWADTKWWTQAFAKHGFTRRVDTEKQLHAQFDSKLYHSRKSFYAFQKQ